MIQDVPTLPWQRIAFDLFTYGGKNYLVITDYLSGFFEIDVLTQ